MRFKKKKLIKNLWLKNSAALPASINTSLAPNLLGPISSNTWTFFSFYADIKSNDLLSDVTVIQNFNIKSNYLN